MSRFTQEEITAAVLQDCSEATFQELKFYADQRLPVEIFARSFAMPRVSLSCALFAATGSTVKVNGQFIARPRKQLKNKRIDAYGGGEIFFSGEELHQDDKRVLMALLHIIRNNAITAPIGFNPRSFVRSLGWSDTVNSVDNLRACLQRLQDATLEIQLDDGRFGLRTKMLGSEFERPALRQDRPYSLAELEAQHWVVSLPDSIRQLFVGSTVYVDIAQYTQLRDGLQTWLFHFLKAQWNDNFFDIKELHKHSGSEATLENFSAGVREAAAKLVAKGLFEKLTFGYGKLRVGRVANTEGEAQ